ncbi:MAG: hypothetical protein AMXMBFR58_37890 [Phycisphaerae bacterium]
MQLAAVTLAVSSASVTASAISSGVVVETVGDYDPLCGGPSYGACCGGICDTLCNVDGDGLWVPLTASGTGWTGSVRYSDLNVWDTDFHDPELTGNPADNDTWNFDRAGTGLSFVCAHGDCDDQISQTCYSDANCPSGSYCPGMPPLNWGEVRMCIQEKARRLVTASTQNAHANIVTYGRNYNSRWPFRSFALGEDLASGPFGGAGTNGGANVSFIVNSCGLRSRYFWRGTSYFFAGVHTVMMAMPTAAWQALGGQWCASDAADTTSRGAEIANAILTNPGSATRDAWLIPSQLAYVDLCGSNHPWGANIVMSRDASQLLANIHVNYESWTNAKRDDLDAIRRRVR